MTVALRKVGTAILSVAGVVTLVFLLLHLIPGDPVEMMLGDRAQPAQREELRHALHLDEPLLGQFGRYLTGLCRGDLGRSIFSGAPVADHLRHTLPQTLRLAGVALSLSLLFGLPLGLWGAARRGDLARTTFSFGTLLGISMPAFWLGPLLMYFLAYRLGRFPISGNEGAGAVVLPALTLGTGMGALVARMTQASLEDVLPLPFLRTARAKGLPRWRVWWRHALSNALLPIVTVVGLQAGALLSGSIVTEKIFSWPGIGLEMVDAIQRRDYPVVQGCVLTIALVYVAIHLFTDLLYAWIDPRIRRSGGRA